MKATMMTYFHKSMGFTIFEVITVLAVVALLSSTMVPMIKPFLDAQKDLKVRKELNAIADALDSFWLEYHTYPSTLSAANFLRHLSPGENQDGIYDDFSYGSTYSYTKTLGPPKTVTLKSMGRDRTLSTSDDISLLWTSERVGRIETRQKLTDIARAATDYLMAYPDFSAVSLCPDANAVVSCLFGLDTWYDIDGFGNSFLIHTTKLRIYSKGPNAVDDTHSWQVTAIAGDDISW